MLCGESKPREMSQTDTWIESRAQRSLISMLYRWIRLEIFAAICICWDCGPTLSYLADFPIYFSGFAFPHGGSLRIHLCTCIIFHYHLLLQATILLMQGLSLNWLLLYWYASLNVCSILICRTKGSQIPNHPVIPSLFNYWLWHFHYALLGSKFNNEPISPIAIPLLPGASFPTNIPSAQVGHGSSYDGWYW